MGGKFRDIFLKKKKKRLGVFHSRVKKISVLHSLGDVYYGPTVLENPETSGLIPGHLSNLRLLSPARR
jgi:hypothetical protein